MAVGVTRFYLGCLLVGLASGEVRRKRWTSSCQNCGGGGGGGGQGSCSTNYDCPQDNPVCSEHGFCQCATYRRGGADCWRQGGGGAGGWGGGSTQPTCSTSSHCPAGTPVCSEYGFCQCASYRPGGPECWQQGNSGGGGGFGGSNNAGGGGGYGGGNNVGGAGFGGGNHASASASVSINANAQANGGGGYGNGGGNQGGGQGNGGSNQGGGWSGNNGGNSGSGGGNCNTNQDCACDAPFCSKHKFCRKTAQYGSNGQGGGGGAGGSGCGGGGGCGSYGCGGGGGNSGGQWRKKRNAIENLIEKYQTN